MHANDTLIDRPSRPAAIWSRKARRRRRPKEEYMTTGHRRHPIEEAVESTCRDRVRYSLIHRSRHLLGSRNPVLRQDEAWCDGELGRLLDNAENQGIISGREAGEIGRIHIITSGENRQDGSTGYAAMELAITVQEWHISTLAARADMLRRATGRPAAAGVMGAFIASESLQQLAEEKNVNLIHYSLDMAKMERHISRDTLREAYSEKVKIDPAQREVYE